MIDLRGQGGCHIDFSPLFPPGGEELDRWYREAKKLIKDAGFDLFADWHVWGSLRGGNCSGCVWADRGAKGENLIR